MRDVTQQVEWELATDSKNNKIWKAPVAKGISVIPELLSFLAIVSKYCLHFQDRKTIKLPSSVFPSEVEEEVGLLNRAAPHSGMQVFIWNLQYFKSLVTFSTGPRLDLDPDIVAALDDDFNYDDPDNELEDDFVAMANTAPTDE